MNFLASLMIPLPLVPQTTPKISQSSAHTFKCLWLHAVGIYNATDLGFRYFPHSKHIYHALLSSIQTLKLL